MHKKKKILAVDDNPDNNAIVEELFSDHYDLRTATTGEEALEIASRTLSILGIAGFEDRITYDLSGGEKRLVSIATVLAMNPEVLLLDEPTTGLDEESKERVSRVLADLPQAMIIVSHERDFVARLVSRTLYMDHGEFVPGPTGSHA